MTPPSPDGSPATGLAATLPERAAGVLTHVSSIPGASLGAPARRFVDWVARAGLCIWQMLPITAIDALDRSPYRALSAFAGEAALIDGTAADAAGEAAFERNATPEERDRRDAFLSQAWLDHWSLFTAIKQDRGGEPWWRWPADLRDRDPDSLAGARRALAPAVAQARWEQFVFDRQWQALRRHAHERGVRLMGDLPILLAHDSADVWSEQALFVLDAAGQPTHVAGVPPDAFSSTGQRWGNPVYDWERMAADGYRWWIERMRNELSRFDLVRIDHFRGFEAYWSIEASEATAEHGEWRPGPGRALFDALYDALGPLPVVAEDLGIITPEVDALREGLGFPGMAVLQFAFDSGDDNPYLPHNIAHNTVVYTGTHDNDTTLAWYRSLDDAQRARVDALVGGPLPWSLVRCALGTRARIAVIPMQDWLGLGEGHRMNVPGTADGNWRWGFEWNGCSDALAARMRTVVEAAGRGAHEHG